VGRNSGAVRTESVAEVDSGETVGPASINEPDLLTEPVPTSIDREGKVGLGTSLTIIILVAIAISICSEYLVHRLTASLLPQVCRKPSSV
jgi:hypothetical protein